MACKAVILQQCAGYDAGHPVSDATLNLSVPVQLKATKTPLLDKAADALLALDKGHQLQQELAHFQQENPWVKDSALFHALTTFHPSTKEKAWWTWEDRALRYAQQPGFGVNRPPEIRKFHLLCPRGPMDKALVYETKDSRFDPGRGLLIPPHLRLFCLSLSIVASQRWMAVPT